MELTCAVIIVSHNYGRFLPQAIESALQQKLEPVEIVVVDDASDDCTSQIAATYAARGVRCLRVEHRNVNRSRESGLKATTAPVVIFLDADDMLSPDYLERGLPLFNDQRIGIVYSDCERFGDETGRLMFPEPEGGNIVAQNFAHAGSLIRRAALELSGCFDDYPTRETQDDWFMWRRIAAAGWLPAKSRSVYHYRRHRQSHTTELRAKKASYFDLAGLRHETITLFVPLSGRTELWPSFAEWLEQQTWPREQVRLVLCDTSQSEEFSKIVRDWMATGVFPDIRHYRQHVGRPGLADEDRWSAEVCVDVRIAMPKIYNRMAHEATTEYVWIVEDDLLPPLDAASTLLRSFNDDVASVSGAYRSRFQEAYVAWRTLHRPLVVDGEAGNGPGTGPEQIRGNGFGCVILRRSVMVQQVFQNVVPVPDFDLNFYEWLATKTKHRAMIDWSVSCEHRHLSVPQKEPALQCKVCGQSDLVHLWNAVCGPWYRCLHCGSDTNPWTYEDVKYGYNGEMIGRHIEICGSREALKADATTNYDWFTMQDIPEKSFLDIGSLAGVALEAMRERGFRAIGFDVMPEAKNFDASTVISPRFTADLFDQQFGCVLMREVIEHIEDWQDALRQVWEVLVPGGIFQVQTPRPTAQVDEMIHQALHLQIFSPMALERALEKFGFAVLDRMFWPQGQAFMCRKPGGN